VSLREKYDAVFVHMNPEYLMLAGILWRVWGKKSALWYVHKHVSLRLRIGALWANTIFTVSPESFRLKGIEARGKIVITGHGIDVDAFIPSAEHSDSDFIITSIGRISPVKGYDTLLDALNLLPKTVGKVSQPTTTKQWYCQILGAAGTSDQVAYEMRIKERVKNEGLSERVRFVGAVPNRDIVPYLQESSVFVNLSGTGSVDKAVLEAMSAGVPSVSSNEAFVPIFNHAVPDFASTLICPAKSAEALADRLETLMNTSVGTREALGKKLRDTVVSDHNLNSLVARITAIMSESK
jgi:glycosyltransferase involved in cell wall biosynthesis